MKQTLISAVQNTYGKTISECSNEELYISLLEITKQEISRLERNTGPKKLYYISAEFLIGKLLSNNLINLGYFEEIQQLLAMNGKSLHEIEEVEWEPSLGNGGLGRLAACFLDSIATLGLYGDGVGLLYHFGLFRQVFENNLQKETPNPWITQTSWLHKSDVSFTVPFGFGNVTSRLYDIDVTGFHSNTNRLRLFDLESVDESIVKDGIHFDKTAIEKNLTLFLYPDDSDEAGHLLRIYQQYFMVSNAAQLIIKETLDRGYKLEDMHKHVVIQINDTHPSMIIPELIRLLGEHGIAFDEAADIVKQTCAYTNHTILAEALEKWPIAYLSKVCPGIVEIIRQLDAKIKMAIKDPSLAIIDNHGRVHMAHMDIHYGFSVNGVAALHTEILKNNELHHFYKQYPEKFNNKTNGITFRRWLMHANPELTSLITEMIGTGYQQDALELSRLLDLDQKVLSEKILEVKSKKKTDLKDYLMHTQNIEIDDKSIFDIQIKRLHEYKRQQMNALYIIYKYNEIKKGNLPATPITMIFGSKAAPAYTIAKDIIHLILCLQELINNDPEVNPYLKVVMVENYNVSAATHLIPACDVSEQISLASKEASGTGNMKFMLNGAITLGTMDGANVEIAELVGEDNIYIFGERSETVIDMYAKHSYRSSDFYQDKDIKPLVDFIVSEPVLALGSAENLHRLHRELINKDWFMTLLDVKSYIETKETVFADYEDRENWSRKMLVNIAKAGFFSTDRTIDQYNKDIWKL